MEDADVRSSEPSPTMERVGSLIEEVKFLFPSLAGALRALSPIL